MHELEAVLLSSREEDVQKYLASDLGLLLAAFGDRWHVNECIPKFRFGNEFISDFVIVTGQSFRYKITLIELEPPTEPPFTKAGKYAKRLNDALGQVNDWLTWIHDNDAYFRASLAKAMKSEYGASEVDRPMQFGDRLLVCTKIIIGRRAMMSLEDNKRRATISDQTKDAVEILPYDRLLEISRKMSDSGKGD